MKWSLLELTKYKKESISFDTSLDITDRLKQKEAMILDAAPVKVKGTLTVEADSYLLFYEVETMLTLPSTRSLEPVRLPMVFQVDELFMTPEQFRANKDKINEQEVLLLETQTLDLTESVVDNIVLAIPLQVLTEEEQNGKDLPSGEGWKVLSEDEYESLIHEKQQQKIDPRLAKLSDFYSDENK
ncbi:YceD family protein [Enterococcus camelliae]|uniref:YceD family protein n=1 Tax=Enterococcus camelliae TaxID=453959 RepID=A0ABW5TFF7_9ENTE